MFHLISYSIFLITYDKTGALLNIEEKIVSYGSDKVAKPFIRPGYI